MNLCVCVEFHDHLCPDESSIHGITLSLGKCPPELMHIHTFLLSAI